MSTEELDKKLPSQEKITTFAERIPKWLRDLSAWSAGGSDAERTTLDVALAAIADSGDDRLTFHPPAGLAMVELKFDEQTDYKPTIAAIPAGAFVAYCINFRCSTLVVLNCGAPVWERLRLEGANYTVSQWREPVEFSIGCPHYLYSASGPDVGHAEFLAQLNKAHADQQARQAADREAERQRQEVERQRREAEVARRAIQRAIEADEKRRKALADAVASFGFCNTADLGAFEDPIEPLIPGLLWPGEPAVLSGPSKCFKSHIAAELAVSVADGSRAFGSFAAPGAPGAVMLAASEFYTETDLKSCIDKIRTARGVVDSGRLLASIRPVNLQNETDTAMLCKVMRAKGVKLLVIDPIYSTSDAMTEAEQAELGETIRGICTETGAAVLVVCHTTRSNGRKPGALPSLADVKGPIFEKLARGWLLVNEAKRFRAGEGKASLNVITGNHRGYSGRYSLEVDQGGSQPSRWVTVLADKSAEQAATAATPTTPSNEPSPELQERVLALLADGEVRSKSAIARAIGAQNAKAEPVLDWLAAWGEIEHAKPKRGATGYRLSAIKGESHSPG